MCRHIRKSAYAFFHRAKPVSEMERSGIEHAQRARQTHQRTRQTHSGISRALRNRQTHRVPAGASAAVSYTHLDVYKRQTTIAGVSALEEHGLRNALIKAADACYEKTQSMK